MGVLVLLVVSTARLPADDAALIRVLQARGFSSLYEEAFSSGSLLLLPPGDAAALLFNERTGLDVSERDALLIVFLERAATRGARASLVSELSFRFDRIMDWTLTALIIETSVLAETAALDAGTLISVTERILDAMESHDVSGGGPERAARALALVVAADRGASLRGAAEKLVLAETLRAIARISRDATTVRALTSAGRALVSHAGTIPN